MPHELRVGCCGFPTSLARYAQVFSAVEVQQTFYQPPALPTVEKWKSRVPTGFEFTLKGWQLITHGAGSPTYRRLREKLTDQQRRQAGTFRVNPTVMASWHRTLECARALRSRLILFQCPARFTPTRENKANVRAFFCEIDRESPRGKGDKQLIYIWEPRGAWETEEIEELCQELGLVHAVDPFRQKPVTKPFGYFRLHGRTGYRYRYTDADLGHLLELARCRVPCYVLFNNVSMLEDARRLMQLVSGAPK